mgnify:CR=1 FL=1
MAKDRFRRAVQDARMRRQGREDRAGQSDTANLYTQIAKAAEDRARRINNSAMGRKLLERRQKEREK